MNSTSAGAWGCRASAAGLALGALLALPSPGAAQQPVVPAPAETVTLEQAIARALETQPQVVQAAGAVRTAEAAERSALGAYLPSLSASAGSSLGGSSQLASQAAPVETGVTESYDAGLSASWQLYTGGRRGAERAQAKAQSASADATLTEQRYGAILATEQAFYEVLRAQELIGVAEARIESAREGLAAAQRRMNVGNATRSDVLRAQLELNTAQESLLRAGNDHNAATYRLGRLVGAEGAVGAAPTESARARAARRLGGGADGEPVLRGAEPPGRRGRAPRRGRGRDGRARRVPPLAQPDHRLRLVHARARLRDRQYRLAGGDGSVAAALRRLPARGEHGAGAGAGRGGGGAAAGRAARTARGGGAAGGEPLARRAAHRPEHGGGAGGRGGPAGAAGPLPPGRPPPSSTCSRRRRLWCRPAPTWWARGTTTSSPGRSSRRWLGGSCEPRRHGDGTRLPRPCRSRGADPRPRPEQGVPDGERRWCTRSAAWTSRSGATSTWR